MFMMPVATLCISLLTNKQCLIPTILVIFTLQAEVDSIQTGDKYGIGLLGFEEFEPKGIIKIKSYVLK